MTTAVSRRFPWWIILGALLIPCAYLPSLSTPFDFIDDGNLVYPMGPWSLKEHWAFLRLRVSENVRHLGPFRPVLHTVWQVEAELFNGNPVVWRLARLVWCMLAAGMLLWLLYELRINSLAALLTTALATTERSRMRRPRRKLVILGTCQWGWMTLRVVRYTVNAR